MKVKICGVTHPDDAAHAARMGADYVGIIFSSVSKRNVTPIMGKAIADAAKEAGAEPVGVFVDETADAIFSLCEKTGITRIQLHGERPRASLLPLREYYRIIYAVPVNLDGSFLHDIPDGVALLFDSMSGGTGMAFDWRAFSPPPSSEWMLAGGLTPHTVANAVTILRPHGVVVAGGVEYDGSTRKDPRLVQAFIQEARSR